MREDVARFSGAGWINCHITFVDVLNDPLFVDDEGRAIAEALLFIEDPVILHDGALEIAEYWESYANLLGEFTVRGNAVNTESENLGVGCFEFGNISLIRLQFLRSTTGECQHING